MTDFLTTDPPADVAPPASTPAVTFTSGGETLLGVLHLPAGPGPHPVVVLLHGFPGNERNFDLAHALRRGGYAALVFHYRGSWGVGGSWSFQHVLEDAATVVTAVRAEAPAHRLDARRLAVVGHSLGGFAALMTAAADPTIAATVSVAGFDFGAAAALTRADPALRSALVEEWDAELLPLRGTSGETLVAEMEAAGDSWRLTGLAPRLADRPVLLIGAARDTVAPVDVHHHPLVTAHRLAHKVFAIGHALPGHALPGHALPGHAVSDRAVSDRVLPDHVVSGHAVSGHVVSDCAVSDRAVSGHVVSDRAVSDRRVGACRLAHKVFPTDHALSDHRVALARTVVGFLDRHLRV